MNPDELVFPLMCHFRVIAENRPGMDFVIETVLMELGVSSPLLPGHESKEAKYLSFNVDVKVESREKMNQIDAALRSIEGVRMVL